MYSWYVFYFSSDNDSSYCSSATSRFTWNQIVVFHPKSGQFTERFGLSDESYRVRITVVHVSYIIIKIL